MRDPAAFWNKLADKYSKQAIKDPKSYERTLDCARKYLSPGDHALEVGCGTGTTALLLAPSVKQLTATDISARMIEIAEAKARDEEVDNVAFQQATLTDANLPEGPFDVVLAFNFLHLLDDMPGGVRKIHALLKPGGTFISKTICLAEWSPFFRFVLPVARLLGFAPNVHCLKVGELDELIAGAGFEIVETGFYPPKPPSRFIVARKP